MIHEDTASIPWVEKYRPKHFDDIVLDSMNRKLFQQILEKNYFPNLLFYGPPGTGKTTTIINLIQEYQTRYSRPNKSNIIHLNASDERGIDIIRNQIYSFVKSMNLFETGFKFVILDEVDYMTKNAQQALKYLLQTTTTINTNVRFILICNYISKIDEALQNEFICVRFNQLPKKDIYEFIQKITEKENIHIRPAAIETIQSMYQSDIRSMINFLQLNQNFQMEEWNHNVLSSELFEKLHDLFKPTKNLIRPADSHSSGSMTDKEMNPSPEGRIQIFNGLNLQRFNVSTSHETIIAFIHKTSSQYNVDKKHIINNYLNYVIRNYPAEITAEFLNIAKECVHNKETNIEDLLRYFCLNILSR